jgi:hypothetical protein
MEKAPAWGAFFVEEGRMADLAELTRIIPKPIVKSNEFPVQNG